MLQPAFISLYTLTGIVAIGAFLMPLMPFQESIET